MKDARITHLCPDRMYRESSPFGGEDPDSYDMGDQHTWHFTHRPGWEHYLDLWRFTDFDYKFLSEFGIIGAMNLALKPAYIKYEIKKLSDTVCELEVSADTFVWMLYVATPDGVEVSDNDFDLLPGIKRCIRVTCEDVNCYKPELYSLNPKG